MPAFLTSHYPRNMTSGHHDPAQACKKICYNCGEPFSKKQGRIKTMPVEGEQGWHVCSVCVDQAGESH